MATESDLRDLLKGPEPEGRAAIDLDAVLTRSRRRRRPRVIAAQALGSVALVGVLGTAIVVSLPRPAQEAAMIAQDTSAGGSEADAAPFVDESARATADVCGEPLTTSGPSVWSLQMTSASGDATTLNAGVRIVATRPDPSAEGSGELIGLSLIRDGVVVAHGSPMDVVTRIGDGPDDGLFWEGTFAVENCDGAPLAPGTYEVRALAQVTLGDVVEVVYGESAALVID